MRVTQPLVLFMCHYGKQTLTECVFQRRYYLHSTVVGGSRRACLLRRYGLPFISLATQMCYYTPALLDPHDLQGLLVPSSEYKVFNMAS